MDTARPAFGDIDETPSTRPEAHTAEARPATVSARAQSEFGKSMLASLRADPKKTEPKFFYDVAGSQLFDRICELDDYYPTRTEAAILRDMVADLPEHLPQGAALVELGSGSSIKTRIILDGLPDLGAYVPVDISGDHLRETAKGLRDAYPGLPVYPLVADFTREMTMPQQVDGLPKVLFFPGSTIGNLDKSEAVELLARLRRLSGVSAFLIGVDLRKDPQILRRAYDDSEGVTAQFNLNLLRRANSELGAGFDLSAFRHESRWNDKEGRVEMHLVSTRSQDVELLGETVHFEPDESIHTESSYKYTVSGFRALAAEAGWNAPSVWTDEKDLFSVHLLTV